MKQLAAIWVSELQAMQHQQIQQIEQVFAATYIYSWYVNSNENSHLNAALEKHQKLIHLPPPPQQCSSLHQKINMNPTHRL
jgi:capsule polysaccharide export protein KpsC/LpsZ